MLKAVKHLTLGIFVALVLVLVGAFALATEVNAQSAEPVTAYLSVILEADGVSYVDLYNFVTDLHNDAAWFPDVADTDQTREADNPPSKVGIEYDQISFFGGLELRNHIVVTGDAAPHYFRYFGRGAFASFDSFYVFHPGPNGSGTFTLTTSFTAPGITEDALRFLLTQAMNNVLTHFNTTGEITFRYINVIP